MSVINTILNRRSTRKYTGEAIPEDKLKVILQAGLLAPTGHNHKAGQFYVVKDREKLEALSTAKNVAAKMIGRCDTAIAVFSDSAVTDTWVEDCSVALSFMSLAATEQGIGNCWVQMHLRRNEDEGTDAEDNVRRILGIEDSNMRVVAILALGIPAQESTPYTLEDADWSKVHEI